MNRPMNTPFKRCIWKKYGWFWMILTIVLGVSVQLYSVDAAGTAENSVHFTHSHYPVEVQLFQIAQPGKDGYVPAEEFKDAALELPGSSSASFAGTVYSHIRKRNIQPAYSVQLDESCQGDAVNLDEGIYLATSSRYDLDNTSYYVNPVTLEIRDGDRLSVRLKPQLYFAEYEQVTVRKVWLDEQGNPAKPGRNEIIAGLFCDGEKVQEVNLNSENNWRGSVPGNGSQHWTVMELDIPEGYTLTIEQDEQVFTLVNRAIKTESPDNPDQPDLPDQPEKPADPGKKNPDQSDGTHTGQSTGLEVFCAVLTGTSLLLAVLAVHQHRKAD